VSSIHKSKMPASEYEEHIHYHDSNVHYASHSCVSIG